MIALTPNMSGNFDDLVHSIGHGLVHVAKTVDTGHWQALKDVPQTKTIELQNVVVEVPIHKDPEGWANSVRPTHCPYGTTRCWAEKQFLERVGGEPLNPGETYKEWPWYRGNVETHKQPGQFSHTYMERFWPKVANGGEQGPGLTRNKAVSKPRPHLGIRYRYGDLNDVLDLLACEPYTRQAYLPIFFPEDTGAHHGERIPCTLGYHLMLREGRLHCFYPIRSCDFLRHFRDDVYMAGRLVQWVISKLYERDQVEFDQGESPDMLLWDQVKPGNLTMHMVSLHAFEGDLPKLRREYGG